MSRPEPIYLDNNATTHLAPEVIEELTHLFSKGVVNPASRHRPGRKSLSILEEAKSQLLDLIDAPKNGMASAQIIITSGGTEANNLAINGIANDDDSLIIVGATEHPSVLDAATHLKHRCRVLPVDLHGRCDLDVLRTWLEDIFSGKDPRFSRVGLVSMMLGNNETGVINDLREACRICDAFQVPVHSDIVQAIGKIPFSMLDSGVSAVTLTAHKFHGPIGVGALVARHDLKIAPTLLGGGQQLGMRPGTEPVILTAAMVCALQLSVESTSCGDYRRLGELRDQFERRVCQIFADNSALRAVVIGKEAERLPQTSTISFIGQDRQALLMALDLAGIACSTGSACSSGSGRPSHVLQAMGLPRETIDGALRFSLSRFTTETEIDAAIGVIDKVTSRCLTN